MLMAIVLSTAPGSYLDLPRNPIRACPQCQRTYPDDTNFCPRDGSPLPSDSLHRVIPADAGIQIDANLAAGLSRRFRLVRRLGAGAMGTVLCRAERRSAQGRAALAPTPPWRLAFKILNRKLLDDPAFLLRFQNEAASTGAFITRTSSPFTNPARPMTARPTSPGSFWKASLSARPSRGGARFPCQKLRKFSSKQRGG